MIVDAAVQAAAKRYRGVLERDRADTITRTLPAARPEPAVPTRTDSQIDLMVDRFAAGLTKRADRFVNQGDGLEAEVPPVRPRVKDGVAYEKSVRHKLLDPMLKDLRSGLSEAVATAEVLDALEANRSRWSTRSVGLVDGEIAEHIERVGTYHRSKLISTFRSALGVDIRPLLNDATTWHLLEGFRRDNIGLIRTIPDNLHDDLNLAIGSAFAAKPFDQRELRRVINKVGKSTGYNLRRLTRDQTNKMVGQLTRVRHNELGITEYVWRTVQDERVRSTHAELNGTRQNWASPVPGVGHPGDPIQCRCTASPIVPGFEPKGTGPVQETDEFDETPIGEALASGDPNLEALGQRGRERFGEMGRNGEIPPTTPGLADLEHQNGLADALWDREDPNDDQEWDLERLQDSSLPVTGSSPGFHGVGRADEHAYWSNLKVGSRTRVPGFTQASTDATVGLRQAYDFDGKPPIVVQYEDIKGLRGYRVPGPDISEVRFLPDQRLDVLNKRRVRLPTGPDGTLQEVDVITVRRTGSIPIKKPPKVRRVPQTREEEIADLKTLVEDGVQRTEAEYRTVGRRVRKVIQPDLDAAEAQAQQWVDAAGRRVAETDKALTAAYAQMDAAVAAYGNGSPEHLAIRDRIYGQNSGLRFEMFQAREELEAAVLEADQTYRAAFSRSMAQFRPMGADKPMLTRKGGAGVPKVRAYIKDVDNVYPTRWYQRSRDYGPLGGRHKERGQYVSEWGGEGTIQVDTKTKNVNLERSTTIHEMGHRFEHVDHRIGAAQQELLARRQAGYGPPEWLGKLTGNPNYWKSEVAIEDKFPDPYMGKIYEPVSSYYVNNGKFKASSQETFTMGMESVAGTRKYRRDYHDQEVYDLTLGLLTTL